MTSLISKSSIPATGRSRIPGAGIDLAKTLECGQVFHWTRCEAGFIGTIEETPSYLEQVDGDLIVPQGHASLHIPSDLAGMTLITYNEDWAREEPIAADARPQQCKSDG